MKRHTICSVLCAVPCSVLVVVLPSWLGGGAIALAVVIAYGLGTTA